MFLKNKIADQYCHSQVPKLEKILDQLKPFGIEYFSYHKFIGLDKYMTICPLRPLTVDSFGYTEDSKSIETQLDLIQQEKQLSLWQCLSQKDLILSKFKELGFNHGIALFKTVGEDIHECCHFSSTLENQEILDFYINNTLILNQFIEYFKLKMGSLLDHEIPGRLYQLETPLKMTPNREFENFQAYKADFTKKTQIVNGHLAVNLTSRQYECLQFLKKGYTSKQIAKILNISPRTIEGYTSAILQKMGISSRNQLINL